MIPNMIDKAAILAAIQQIDEEGIPRQRLSHTYNLRYGGKLYPPKYVISLDKIDLSRDGIIHLNLIDFLLSEEF